MKKLDLTRYAPPGIDLKYEKNTFVIGFIIATLRSTGFLFWLNNVYHNFFDPDAILEPGMMFPEFLLLIRAVSGRDYLVVFRILIPCMLAFTIYHYLYHRTLSKSVYLMRRLPDRWEYHRRCLTLPLVGAGLVFLAEVILLLFYFWIYILVIPEANLVPGQFATIWRALL